jgi:hypothetical protein
VRTSYICEMMMMCTVISWWEQVTFVRWWWCVQLYHGENKLHLWDDDDVYSYTMVRTSYICEMMMMCTVCTHHHHLIKCNLFSPWYNCTHHHHLTNVTCSHHDITVHIWWDDDDVYSYIMVRTGYICDMMMMCTVISWWEQVTFDEMMNHHLIKCNLFSPWYNCTHHHHLIKCNLFSPWYNCTH